MSQPFSPRSNSLSRLSIFVAVVATVGSFALGETLVRSGYHTGVGEMVEQPLPFSHQHHVQGLGLDCRFCHTTVERSAFAGYPDTQTCMTCHSQIWKSANVLKPVRDSFRTGEPLQWWKVNRLPDYVYFNHGIHVTKGIGCITCHGQVIKMANLTQIRTFFMRDCLECHEAPAHFIRPANQVLNEAWQSEDQEKTGLQLMQKQNVHAQEITDCSRCHR